MFVCNSSENSNNLASNTVNWKEHETLERAMKKKFFILQPNKENISPVGIQPTLWVSNISPLYFILSHFSYILYVQAFKYQRDMY